MENTGRLNDYLALLKIRQKSYQRNVIIAGGLFLFALLSTTATLLLTEWNERSIWLIGMLDVLFFISFLIAWVRFEITNAHIELISSFYIRDY
jgi:hypothetical protein